MAYYQQWAPYVSVAQRRAKAHRTMGQLRKQGVNIQPIEIDGRTITKTFWGKAWCDHMESLGDYSNRLPRGRRYVRNGSVCHLEIEKGRVAAMVSGSEIYKIEVKIDVLPKTAWNKVKSRCAGQIGSLLELLQGKFSGGVMQVVTDSRSGLFPLAKEIRLGCSCPDWAVMCKHVAAVLYGVGARLDVQPELLFLLRGVNHEELIDTSADRAVSGATSRGGKRRTVATADLADVFGIDVESDAAEEAISTKTSRKKNRAAKSTKGKTSGVSAKKKAAEKTAAKKTAGEKTPGKKVAKKPLKGKSTKGVIPKKRAAKKKASTSKKAAQKTISRKTTAKKTTTKSTKKAAASKPTGSKKSGRRKVKPK